MRPLGLQCAARRLCPFLTSAMSWVNWPCKKDSASSPVTRINPRSSRAHQPEGIGSSRHTEASSSESRKNCLCSDCAVVLGRVILNPNMQLNLNHADSSCYRPCKRSAVALDTLLISILSPVLGLCGLLLSEIPPWARIIGCVCIVTLQIKHWMKKPQCIPLEINDGDLLRYHKAGHIILFKVRKWGWAGPWGLNLAVSGIKQNTVFLSSAEYPPSLLRRLIRHRMYSNSYPEDQDVCVQAPAKPRLWI